MITLICDDIKDFSEKIYDQTVDQLPIYLIPCSCGHSGCLVRHAYYSRKLKRRNRTLNLCILRLKCKECGRTHAVLTNHIVPYEQVSLDVQKEMILYSVSGKEMQDIMEANPEITESDTAAVKRRYKKSWIERLKSVGMEATCELKELVQTAFTEFHRQFMQIRRGINLAIPLTHLE